MKTPIVPAEFPVRQWPPEEVVSFRKTREEWGGLSNMASGFPITLGTSRFRTSEALYQAMRFPSRPDVQQLIADQASPMAAKMKSKEFRRDHSHPTWDEVRVSVMFWCLQLKLAQNWQLFGQLLRSTGIRSIVEESHRDRFWGAVQRDGLLAGSNVLGCLLTILRDGTDLEGQPPVAISPPSVGLRLLDLPILIWTPDSQTEPEPDVGVKEQLSLGWE